ncbi:MAG TPA: YMGG-like glycine zipper-containing protein [bacterium]|nr:YMGG-like glycine zipper-containing protein [bacterium]
MKRYSLVILGAVLMISAIGCNTTQKGAAIGAATGGVVGGVIGHQTGHTTGGAVIGAGVGAVTGGVIGHQIDKKNERESGNSSVSQEQQVQQPERTETQAAGEVTDATVTQPQTETQ